ncbi:hypothetical protein DPMN_030150 [Dreissena polymorpha]|uniref:Uncharacterized protein n=1 Tax=Dreissena polymorpha TaxID=45954 RepID=A0A9D4LZE1_DREPO|nr:hypothetical protein DPMN_030150 [Dreissena polymorpha]
MTQATNLYFDHPQEPDPEERGLYWATRFTDTRKVFDFRPDALYDNIREDRSGNPQSKQDICGEDMSKCTLLEKPENVLGRFPTNLSRSFTCAPLSTLSIPLLLSSQQFEYVTMRKLLCETNVGILK